MTTVTITQVAERVGVSVATVSRFLSGNNVREEDAIREAIAQLNYRPSAAARNLKSGKTSTIAVIVPDIANPFFASIVRGAEKAAGEKFMVLLVNTDGNPNREERILTQLFGRVDGVIMVPLTEDEVAPTAFGKFGFPIVFVDRISKESHEFDSVLVDNVKGSRLAVEKFIALGHTRIAMIGGPLDSTPGKLRRDGFHAALKKAKIENNPEYFVEADFNQVGGFAAMTKLLDLDNPPTAVLSANNLMTIGALEAIKSRGVCVPEELSFIGFDDIEMATLLVPPLTVVSRDVESQGAEAMRIMINRLDPNNRLSPQHKMIDVKLIERGSCSNPWLWSSKDSKIDQGSKKVK
ncbi:unannotated protein [freshwater metagenome]|uniref:Unannotated protein n=1 Tax=freshwater metagenome TaxID=449393 RepID=A0A6J7XNY0_9ZZZZ|nr:substrate-binding domain-containing protein [Actinomycetota bacterium]